MYYPQSPTRGARPSKQTREASLFYPFSRNRVLFDQYTSCPQRWMRVTAQWTRPSRGILLFADSIKQRADQKARPERGHMFSYCQCGSTRPITFTLCQLFILYSSSVLCTYAGMRCLVFWAQCEHSWAHRWLLTSGSKQSNDHLLHTCDSTCNPPKQSENHLTLQAAFI